MKRKYLDDLGIKDRHDLWNPNDNRQSIWQRQRREYGFDERETVNAINNFGKVANSIAMGIARSKL